MLSAPVEHAPSFADRGAAGLPAGSPEALVGHMRPPTNGGFEVACCQQTGGQVSEEMRAAYALIAQYQCGEIEPGTEITQEQDRLIRLLGTDLQVEMDGLEIGNIVSQVARADKHWNQQTMTAVCDFYDRREAGSTEEAEAVRASFLSRCPSAWYCGVVADL